MSRLSCKPILIAGPTASGKSSLALGLADRTGATVVNADALQVYGAWRVLTARPSAEEESRAPHELYGHVAPETAYSVGAWLREIKPLVASGKPLIIVGGTGLYLSALTRGLAPVPHTPPAIRAEGDTIRAEHGLDAFRVYLRQHDPVLYGRLDLNNGMRLQRAWEVHRATGVALSEWQKKTPEPLISKAKAVTLKLESGTDWLASRIERRFDAMIKGGALEEVEAAQDWWDQGLPASRALGAPELMAHVQGELTLREAVERGVVATRQYAKRQRTWFRSNMRDWHAVDACSASEDRVINQIISMI